LKTFLIRILVVIAFLIVAILIINKAPQYELVYKYKDGDLRVIYNNQEITRDVKKLPEVAVYYNGEVLLSQDTIDILFDKDLYYEEKYNTLITTSNEHRANIEVGSSFIVIDNEKKSLSVPAIKDTYKYSDDDRYTEAKESKEIIYVPIKALEDVYEIDIDFEDKLIITSRNADIYSVVVPSEKSLDLKYLEDDNSKTIYQVPSSEEIKIFNYDNSKQYNLVRTKTGELGYALTSTLEEFGVSQIASKKEIVPQKEQIRMAWDYVNPDYNTIGDKDKRSKESSIDIVAPTLLHLQDSTGEVKYRINQVEEYSKWAKNVGYEVWVTFKNDNKTIDETSAFLNDMNNRDRAIKQLIEVTKKNGFSGINIDIEEIYLKDATAFSQFIRELSVETRRNNLILSVCVNIPDGSDTWSKCYQHYSLSEAADYLAVMTYDMRSGTGASYAPYDWVEENIQKLVERDHVPSEKLILGIPFCSAYWKVTNGNSNKSIYYMNSAKKYMQGATWNETAKQYYYENENKGEYIWIEESKSINEKIKLAKEYGLSGYAFWCLGQESSDLWGALEP